MSKQYITPPPEIPMFLYKTHASALQNLIKWAVREHQDRIKYCAARGYWKELKRLNEDYSPIRVLAELNGYRKICAIVKESWYGLSMRERAFVRRAYEIRELLGQEIK